MNPPDTNPPDTAQDRRFRERLVRRAIETRAPLLAATLNAHARAEGLDWRGLAGHLGCTPDALNHIALCRPPRAEQFAEDVAAIAADLVDFDRLLNLLRRLQILDAFAAYAAETPAYDDTTDASIPTGGMLLAARDREEEEEIRRQGDKETGEGEDSSFITPRSALPEGEDS